MNVNANQFILLFYTVLYCSDYLLVLERYASVIDDSVERRHMQPKVGTVITGTTHTQ